MKSILKKCYYLSVCLRRDHEIKYSLNSYFTTSAAVFDSDIIFSKFLSAAKSNDEATVENLLEDPSFKHEEIIEGTDSFGNSPIML